MTTLTDADRDEREAAESWAAENRADQRRDDAPFVRVLRDPREIAYHALVESRKARERAGVDERPASTFDHAAGAAAGVCAHLLASGHEDTARAWAAAYDLLYDRSLRRSGVKGVAA